MWDKTKSKDYIKILRHPSLQTGLSNMHSNLHAHNAHNKRDIHVQKTYVKNVFFPNLQHISMSTL